MVKFNTNIKRKEVQRAVLNVVNTHCPGLTEFQDGPRNESRVNLTLPAWVVPLADGQPVIARAFVCVTKEFSTNGLSLVVNRSLATEEVIVGLQTGEQPKFFSAVIRHVDPIGAGFSQLGVQLTELLSGDKFPELDVLNF